jgi:hypothetical protein
MMIRRWALECLLQQSQNATSRARLMCGRSEQELTARVRQGCWSVTECLEHLSLTTRVFLPTIAQTMATAPALVESRPLRCDTLAKFDLRRGVMLRSGRPRRTGS